MEGRGGGKEREEKKKMTPPATERNRGMEGAKKRAKKLFNEHTRNEEDNSGPRMVVVGAREKECSPLFDTSQNLRIG